MGKSADTKAQQVLWSGCRISSTGSSAPSLGLQMVGIFKEYKMFGWWRWVLMASLED